MQSLNNEPFNNIQLGINAGYAYSWVDDKQWLITGMATAGANFGNETELVKGKVQAISYHYGTCFLCL